MIRDKIDELTKVLVVLAAADGQGFDSINVLEVFSFSPTFVLYLFILFGCRTLFLLAFVSAPFSPVLYLLLSLLKSSIYCYLTSAC